MNFKQELIQKYLGKIVVRKNSCSGKERFFLVTNVEVMRHLRF